MTKQKAKSLGYTHIGYTYNIVKIYAKNVYNESPEITGVNFLHNILLELITWLDVNLVLSDGFYMEVYEI